MHPGTLLHNIFKITRANKNNSDLYFLGWLWWLIIVSVFSLMLLNYRSDHIKNRIVLLINIGSGLLLDVLHLGPLTKAFFLAEELNDRRRLSDHEVRSVLTADQSQAAHVICHLTTQAQLHRSIRMLHHRTDRNEEVRIDHY